MQKFHPALWLWGITNTDDGYLLWSWADKWPFCEVTLPSSKKVEIVLGLKTISCFQLTPLIMTTQTKSTHIARLRRYWNSWKGEFSGQDSGFFFHFWSLFKLQQLLGSLFCLLFLSFNVFGAENLETTILDHNSRGKVQYYVSSETNNVY